MQAEVDRINRVPGAIDRNVAITEAYETLARDMPENDWVRLASYVSVQGGCAMKEADSLLSRLAPDGFISADGMLDALKDANTTIFNSIHPARFAANCGLEKLRECAAEGAVEVPPDIMEALEKMEAGDLRGAADQVAVYE
ncbi:DUF2515 family protein [Jannaschia marina]|uniref:DUF2515 family protein n=1 Tax=Jannaschia marina TaxID=2741674 RepID=UPI0015CC350B|nr:hypothetical protein [Jannaschia marina]